MYLRPHSLNIDTAKGGSSRVFLGRPNCGPAQDDPFFCAIYLYSDFAVGMKPDMKQKGVTRKGVACSKWLP
jgi:hypothetical protein